MRPGVAHPAFVAALMLLLAGCGTSAHVVTVTTRDAAPDPAETVLNSGERCGQETPEVKPTKLVLTCATGEVRIERLQWERWGTRIAQATGVINVQGCDPSCAEDNRTYSYSVKVTAHRPAACDDGSRRYAFFSWTVTDESSDSNRPNDGTMGFDCPT
jgi:hypothetical protein